MMPATAALLLCNQKLLIAVFCLCGCWRGRTGITNGGASEKSMRCRHRICRYGFRLQPNFRADRHAWMITRTASAAGARVGAADNTSHLTYNGCRKDTRPGCAKGIATAIKCLILQAACRGTAGTVAGMIDIAGKMAL